MVNYRQSRCYWNDQDTSMLNQGVQTGAAASAIPTGGLSLIAPLVLSAAEFAWGAHQKSQADQRIKALGNPPNYTVSPELQDAYDRALGMSRYGYSPEEKGAFRQNIGTDINTKSRNALDVGGGGVARAVSKIGRIDETNAENKFAVGDANLHRRNITMADQMARAVQSQKNLGTREDIHAYDSELGYDEKAGAEGVRNMFGGLNLGAEAITHYTNQRTTPLNPYQMAQQQWLKQNMPTAINPIKPQQIPTSYSGAPDSELNYNFWQDYQSPQSQFR